MKTNTRHWAGITAAGILSLAGYASAATLGSEKYTYDASGNIIEKSIDGVVTKMAYDQANRLIERQTAGQAKQTTAYDNAGRPVTERNADGQTTRCLSYGYVDKVLETQNQNSKAGFYYNAEGQLVGRNVEGTVSTYTWDGNVLAAENTEPCTNEAHISGGVPVLASGTDVVVSDHLGNTLASGAKQFASTAYGEGLERGRLTGKPFVEELRGYLFHHRMYAAENMRWFVADPTGFPNGINNYLYVNGDPLSRFDVLGLTLQATGGLLINSTNHCGTGWPLDFEADGMTTTITGGQYTPDTYIRTTYIFSEYVADLASGAVAVLLGGTMESVGTPATTFTINAGTDSTSRNVSDADDLTGSGGGAPGFICGAGGGANAIPIPRHIGWSTLEVFAQLGLEQ